MPGEDGRDRVSNARDGAFAEAVALADDRIVEHDLLQVAKGVEK